MPELETATALLTALRSDLKREKEAILALLKDPQIADWNTIDYKKHSALLNGVGIAVDPVKDSINGYQQQAKKIGKQIGEWTNEIANQLADCIDCPNPEAALAAAQKLEGKIRGFAALKEELQAIIRPLLAAGQGLRQQLGVTPLVAIATLLAPSKKDQIVTGAEALPLLTQQPASPGEGQSLCNLRQEPERLEARLRHLDVTKLPRLIEEILFHHIEKVLSANQEVKVFLDAITERMDREITMIAAIEKDLRNLQTESPAGLIKGITAQAQILVTLLLTLYHKRGIQDTINTTISALDSINIFCLLMKSRIIPGLQKEVEVIGSSLNPTSISARMTRSFFEGTSGIIRSLKLMMKSLQGQGAISEIELQLILEKGISNCKTFCGGSRNDLDKTKAYIDSLIGHFPKPFPYNDLFKLTKTTLLSYGEEVEKFIADHEIPKEQQVKIASSPTKVGGLIAAINKYNATFQKANTTT